MAQNISMLINILKNRGFINKICSPGLHDKYFWHYGTPGTIMRRNILHQWWFATVQQQSNTFPVEGLNFMPMKVSSSKGPYSCENSTEKVSMEDLSFKYQQVLKLANSQLPFSIASIGHCPVELAGGEDDSSLEDEQFFTRGQQRTKMILWNYVHPSSSHRVFDYWLQLRLSWWKNFSRNPSHFSVAASEKTQNGTEDSTSGGNVVQSMSIMYEFPWGKETVENLCNFGDSQLKFLQDQGDVSYMAKVSRGKSCLPHCIECDTSLESVTSALLLDSFLESRALLKSKSSKKTNPVLQIHPLLAPFQVAIFMGSKTSEHINELKHVSNQIEQDLQIAGLSVFNASSHNGTLEAHSKRNDELGIPYTIILKEDTLKNGLIEIRSRDTEVKKPLHISLVAQEIQRNCKAVLE